MRANRLQIVFLWIALILFPSLHSERDAIADDKTAPMPNSAVAPHSDGNQPKPADWNHLRRIYVPANVLESIFNQDNIAAIMPAAEFDKLLEAARQSGSQKLPELPPSISSTEYNVTVDHEQLQADVKLTVISDVPHSELDLPLSGWNVKSARLGEQPAILSRAGEGGDRLRLYLPDAGTHTFQLQLSTSVQVVGTDQVAGFSLLGGTAGQFRITIPPQRHLVVNGTRLARPASADEPAVYEVPIGGRSRMDLLITDQDTMLKSDLLTFASTAYGVQVQPSEITWSARTELQIYGQSIDRLTCRVPQNLEITRIESVGLESWELSDDPMTPGRTTITLKYRQSFEGSRSILLKGILSEAPDQPWTVPNLTIAQVTAHSGMIFIALPDQVRLQTLESAGVRPVAALPQPGGEDASPQSFLDEAGPGNHIRFEVWREDFELRFVTAIKEQAVQAALTSLLMIGDQGLDLSLTLGLQTRQTPLFDARVRIPAQFRVLSATLADGKELNWDVVPAEAGVNEVRITLDPPLLPGQTRTVVLLAGTEPENWPVQQTPVVMEIPDIRLPQAAMLEALYGISAPDDLELVPLQITGLDPVGQEKLNLLNSRLQQSGQRIRLGFSYQDSVFKGQLKISRKPTLFTADSLIFFRVDRETTTTRLESRLSLIGGGVRELRVRLSESAGERVRFSLFSNDEKTSPAQLVEQIPGEVADGMREWNLILDRFVLGEFQLQTELQLTREATETFSPVQIVFPQAEAQSGILAIEGPPDEQLQVTALSADGQPLATVDPVDLPASSYQPRERIVAGYRFVRPDWTLNVRSTRFNREAIPSAVGHSAHLESVWSPGSAFQHQATYILTAVGMQSLQVKMPEHATLWSILIDSQPVEARQGEQGIQIPLTGVDSQRSREVTLLYETPSPELQPQGKLRAHPPAVSVVAGNGDVQPLQILTQHWSLHYPNETTLVDSSGQFRPQQPLTGETWLGRLRNLFRWPHPEQAGFFGAILLAIALGVWLLRRAWDWLLRVQVSGWIAFLIIGVPVCLVILSLPRMLQKREVASRAHQIFETSDSMDARQDEGNGFPNVGTGSGFGIGADEGMDSALAEPSTDALQSQRREMADKSEMNMRQSAPAAPGAQPNQAAGSERELLAQQQATMPRNQQASPTPNDSVMEAGERAGSARVLQSAGGLLSMTFSLEIPENTRSQTFYYNGNSSNGETIDLQVRYANRTTGRGLVCAVALGVLLLGWWMRSAGRSVKFLLVLLTVVIPLALLGVAPVWWLVILQGMLVGGLLTIFAWCLASCRCSLFEESCLLRNWWRSRGVAGAALLWFILSASSLSADEPQLKTPATNKPFVVIPYKSLENLSAADQVWIPADLFQRLWKAGHPDNFPPPRASVSAALVEALYSAKVSPQGDVTVQLRWVLMNFTDQPQSVPLPISSPALKSPQLDGRPAALTPLKEAGKVAAVLPKRGLHILDAELQVTGNNSAQKGEFQLQSDPVPAGMLTIDLPATESPRLLTLNGAAQRGTAVEGTDEIRYEIPVDRGGRFWVRWHPPKAPGQLDHEFQLETALTAEVENIGVWLHHGFRIQVRKGSVADLVFEVPEQLAVRQVTGSEVRSWKLESAEDKKLLKVTFTEPISGRSDFQADLFLDRPLAAQTEQFSLTGLVPQGVERETGQVALSAPESLRVRPVETPMLQQIDVPQFKPAMKIAASREPLQFAYRFISRPWSLKVDVTRRQPEARGTIEHGVNIGRRKVIIASRFVAHLSGAPRRLVNIALPEGYLPLDVVCPQANDWYVTTTDGQPRLTIELDQPRTGEIEIGLQGHLVKSPEDETVPLHLPVPLDFNRAEQFLGVWIDETYQASLGDAGKWRSVASRSLPPSIRQLQPGQPQYAFAASGESSPLTFSLRRATPEVTADAGILIAVGDVTLDYGLTLRWKIANAATDQFVFTVPDWLGILEFSGSGIRQVLSEPAGDGRTRWSISLIDPVRDQYLVTAAATIASPTDQTVRTPQLEFESPTGVGTYERVEVQRQFAVLVNLSKNQLTPRDLEQFELVAADQLPLTMPQELVQQAVEIIRVREGKLPSWKIEPLQQSIGSQAIVSTVTLTTVLQMDGSWRTQAVYGIRNRGQQFLALRLPEGSRILSVFVRGDASRPVLTQLDEKPIHLIALPQTSAADLTFDVSLLMEGELDQPLPELFSLGSQKVQLPAPAVVSPKESEQFGLPVATTLWSVFVPDEVEALPVEKSGQTNVSFHRGAGVFAAQLQMLDRIRSDIAEMKRIASDVKYSKVQRGRAIQNLKQLQDQIRNYQNPPPTVQSNADSESALLYQQENSRAISDAESALQDLSKLERQMDRVPSQDRSAGMLIGNRNLIQEFNADLLRANSLPDTASQQPGEEPELNFYKADDLRRSNLSGKKAVEEKDSRKQLKRQLEQQIVQPNAVPSSKQSQPSFRFVPQTDDFSAVVPKDIKPGANRFDSDGIGASLWGSQNLQIEVDQTERIETQQQDASVLPAVTTQGLSVAMTMPKSGHELTFDKLGGAPVLTLAVRPRRTWDLLLGGVWGIACLIAGLWAVRRFLRAPNWRIRIQCVCVVLLLLAILITLTGPMHLAPTGVGLFCLGAVGLAILARRSTRAAS